MRNSTVATIALGLAALGATAVRAADAPASTSADTIYRNGRILTMAGPEPAYVDVLAVGDGKILFAGSAQDAKALEGRGTKVVDLEGRTLLPGFIDTHGHMIYFGKNLIDADLVGSKNMDDLVERLKEQAKSTPEGAWIVGFGYRARDLAEGRPPTIDDLDRVSKDRPVMVVDASGHLGAGNSVVFREAGVSAETPDPEGGAFARKPGGRELLGPMEETALNAVRNRRPALRGRQLDDAVTGAARVWARHGHTTAQEAGVGLGADDVQIVLNAIDKQLLPIDLWVAAKDSNLDATLAAAYTVASEYDAGAGGSPAKLLAARPDLDRRYVNRVRLGGVKFWLDGSMDTAWFTQPYSVNPPGKTGSFAGYQQIPDEVLDAAFDRFWTTNLQINMHMNGDAAADQALRAIEKAVAKHGMGDHRPVFIHATYLRPDQVERMKKFGAVPSFLSVGIVSGGDAVQRMWGPDRASTAMASRTMLENGIPFTFSHDAPVTPVPSVLALVDAGVNRTSASGTVVGPDQRITPYQALKAVTANAAWQIKEEKAKGTLEPGKLADLVVLDRNPLEVPPATIKDIAVVETIKEGKSVYHRD